MIKDEHTNKRTIVDNTYSEMYINGSVDEWYSKQSDSPCDIHRNEQTGRKINRTKESRDDIKH